MEQIILKAMFQLIFAASLLFYISVDGMSVISKAGKNVKDSGYLSDDSEEMASNNAPAINPSLAACSCRNGYCEGNVCKCNPGWRLVRIKKFRRTEESCKECACGKQFGCEFRFDFWGRAKKTKCLCTTGYTEVNKRCKATCEPNPCQNGGKCTVKGDEIVCECPQAYTGDLCDRDKCKDYCLNGGNCNVDNDGFLKCQCPPEFGGIKCEIVKKCKTTCNVQEGLENIDVKCEEDIIGDFWCNCKDRYKMFNTKTNKCEISKCKTICNVHDGLENIDVKCEGDIFGDFWCNCKDPSRIFNTKISKCEKCDCRKQFGCEFRFDFRRQQVQKTKCICTTGYTEVNKICKATCEPNPCQNGGKCTVKGDENECECPQAYTGDLCDTEKCKDYCLNGGTCNVDNGFPKCQCPPEFGGNKCEKVDYCKFVCGNATCDKPFEEKTVQDCKCEGENITFDETARECKEPIVATLSTVKDIAIVSTLEISTSMETSETYEFTTSSPIMTSPSTLTEQECTERRCLNGQCNVVNDQEVCNCFEGFYLDESTCFMKDCSRNPCHNGTCVVRNNGYEQCICPSGYTLESTSCVRGKCRTDTCIGGQCKIIDGELTCVCPERYGLEGIKCVETVCKIQRCFGGNCVVEEGNEICTCPKGYKLVYDVCKLILCEKKTCFGGTCQLQNGMEECVCPAGYTLLQDVCRENILKIS